MDICCFKYLIIKPIFFMKQLTCIAALVLMRIVLFAQQPLPDGLYLVEEMDFFSSRFKSSHSGKALVKFNPKFTIDNPDDYNPILVNAKEFVPFELAMAPIAQYRHDREKILLLKLTEGAAEKLRLFTLKYLHRRVVMVVNGEALTVHLVTAPITSGLLHISRGVGMIAGKFYNWLDNTRKN
jgi:hypothetical protein